MSEKQFDSLELPRPRIVRRWPAFSLDPKRKKRMFLVVAVVVGVLVLGTIGWLGWKAMSNVLKATNGNLAGLLSNTKLKGEDSGRVNILLAGNSADDPGHGGGELTDSLMILSIDTKQNTAVMLSIPRDLWVDVPGYGHQKINAANADGGMDLLKQVVKTDFGLDINYYALVNYTAFKQSVDAVGGIDITVASADPRGIYDPNIAKADKGPLVLKNGLQHLDGQTALNLARARNDPTPDGRYGYGLPKGDFDRAANQRLMLLALKTKILSAGVMSNPLKIGQLLDALGSNVKTDFQTNELRRLYDLGSKIDSGKIQSLALTDGTSPLVVNYTTSDGQAALAPAAGVDDFGDIQRYLRQLTSRDPVVKEGAKVVVLNGSGVSGLAKQQAASLESKGVQVIAYETATGEYPTSEIIDNLQAHKPATSSLLKGLFGPHIATDDTLKRAYPTADFIVILGTDRGN
ncbi:MAG: hypothetical protein JWN01_1016 [Patescibacteria group bacterium]|nr:hypothetical protein [Patescibacteria group bacterium]